MKLKSFKFLFTTMLILFTVTGCAGSAQEILSIKATDHVKGPDQTPITLVEYGDFQCPSCGAYHQVVKRLLQDYPNDVQFTYRHLPLISIHKNAFLAAKAAESADMQGKFWEMYDKLFENQKEWSESDDAAQIFTNYAGELGLDKNKFIEDLKGKDSETKVRADYQDANALGLSSTPSFFLNGEPMENVGSYDDLKKLIEEKIKGSETSSSSSNLE